MGTDLQVKEKSQSAKSTAVTGHLAQKNGYYYAVLNLRDSKGYWKPKWFSTGLKIKGNKTRAQGKLEALKREYSNKEKAQTGNSSGILFSDFMRMWLETKKSKAYTTYAGYRSNINNVIAPYFDDLGVTVDELTASDISDFYKQVKLERGIKSETLKRYHANIRNALQVEFMEGRLVSNVADRVNIEQDEEEITHNYYTVEQINELLPHLAGEQIMLPVLLTAFYGFRRSETMGLKWNALDLRNNTITVRHILTESVDEDGSKIVVTADRGKRKKSYRTLPLIPELSELLKKRYDEQKMYQKVCGKSYCQDYLHYVFVDELGYILKPSYVSNRFKLILKKNGLPVIRFHDLRHSCVSLLIAAGVPMKLISEWVGHSSFVTTANTYGHLESRQFNDTALLMKELLKL